MIPLSQTICAAIVSVSLRRLLLPVLIAAVTVPAAVADEGVASTPGVAGG